MNGEGRIVDCRHAGREPRPTCVVTIFVPPAVFYEVQAILNTPVLSNVPQEIGCGYLFGIETAHVIARIVQHDFAIVRTQLTIDTQANLATWQIERFSNVIGVV